MIPQTLLEVQRGREHRYGPPGNAVRMSLDFDAIRAGVFATSPVMTPTRDDAATARPSIVARVTGTELFAVITRWNAGA
jgi:hypothetical protein